MGYIDIIKRGIGVANKNLWAILTQLIASVALVMVFAAGAVVLILAAAGSLAGVKLEDFKPEDITALIQSSVVMITVVVFLFLLFLLLAMLVMSYVIAGNTGCMIETAKGDAAGFTSSGFFGAARRSAIWLFFLYILLMLIFLGVFAVFAAAGGIGIWGVLLPLKDAGRQLIAFAVGVPFLVVLILGFLVAWFFIYAGSMVSSVILVGDDTGPLHAIGAAYGFMKRNFWDALLFTLLVVVLSFAANMASQIITLPFNLMSESNPMMAIALLPLMVVSMVFQMYVSIAATSAFAVYYLDRTAPPAPEPEPEGPGIPDEPEEELLLEPEIMDEEEKR
ncbi:MAG: hypothetical protein HZA22_01455 [Nitrospirae bacterium]|nr:hypothetical protein [Nitrospirota bacterium]